MHIWEYDITMLINRLVDELEKTEGDTAKFGGYIFEDSLEYAENLELFAHITAERTIDSDGDIVETISADLIDGMRDVFSTEKIGYRCKSDRKEFPACYRGKWMHDRSLKSIVLRICRELNAEYEKS